MSGTNFLIGFDVAGFTLTWGPEIQEPLNHFLNFLQRELFYTLLLWSLAPLGEYAHL